MLSIIQAQSSDHMAATRELMLEYAHWLDFNLCFQGFDEELQTLPGKYAPPSGRLLLAYWNGELAGMGALRPLSDHQVCEMKRLYVRPAFRGHSLGRALAEQLVVDAVAIGYKMMRLDTIPGKMEQAIALYRELGFRETAPYYGTPVGSTLFMELILPDSYPAKPKA